MQIFLRMLFGIDDWFGNLFSVGGFSTSGHHSEEDYDDPPGG